MKRQILGSFPLILLSSGVLVAQESVEVATEADTQQAAIDSLEPAVTTSADEIDMLEPGVSTDELMAEAVPASSNSGVMDELDLGTSEVTGNQELPKVLYIVPWRQSDPGDLMGRPANSLLEDVLAPVDRGEFIREVDYYSDLFSEVEPE